MNFKTYLALVLIVPSLSVQSSTYTMSPPSDPRYLNALIRKTDVGRCRNPDCLLNAKGGCTAFCTRFDFNEPHENRVKKNLPDVQKSLKINTKTLKARTQSSHEQEKRILARGAISSIASIAGIIASL